LLHKFSARASIPHMACLRVTSLISALFSATLWTAHSTSCADGGECHRSDDAMFDEDRGVKLLQKRVSKLGLSSDGQVSGKRTGFCEIGAQTQCPGSNATCAGDQCCPGTAATDGKTFPCPSANFGFEDCGQKAKVKNCAPCVCSFDLDRTLTGEQSSSEEECPDDEHLPGVLDWAYDGGNLTLSAAAKALGSTFCGQYQCFMAVVTAGDGTGYESDERHTFENIFQESGGRLPSTVWSGPSALGENRTNCSGVKVESTLVAGCNDATKQFALDLVLAWLKKTENVTIPHSSVWHYDDKGENIEPFQGTGYNARVVSCSSRDVGAKGYCGATVSEITDTPGVILCENE